MKTAYTILSVLASAVLILGCGPKQVDGTYVKPRVIVTCDPELDDNNSMIRYVLHANDFQTEALVYNASRFHWRGDGKGTTQFIPGSEYDNMGLGPQTSWRYKWDERFIDDIVDAYGKCYENLKVHDPGYPTYEELKSKIRIGNVDFEGEIDHDTPGSDLIKEVILDDKPGKVYCQAWGGSSSIARALKSIEEQNKANDGWDALYKKICEKLVLCFSGDQDGCYVNYIAINWPDIPIMTNNGKMSNYDNSVYDYQTSPEYTVANITIGPLGALVRTWGDGKQMVEGDKTDFIGPSGEFTKEELQKQGYIIWRPIQPKGTWYGDGDSGCYFNLIDNGLRAWVDDTWGGWSGRRKLGSPDRKYTYMGTDINAQAKKSSKEKQDTTGLAEILALYRNAGKPDENPVFPNLYPERMNQLVARMKWSVTPEYADANHFPVVKGPFDITAKAGEKVKINARVSDPDGNDVKLKWWVFPVGTYSGDVAIENPSVAQAVVTIPADAQSGQTIHLVLQATDNGFPELTRYLRTIITVK